MVPSDFIPYFSTSAGAAAALIGLLFVAASLAPESTLARSAPIQRRAIAVGAFTGLLNAFFISLSALIPNVYFAGPLLSIAIASLISTFISIGFLLARRQRTENTLRLLLIPLVSFVIYSLEIALCALPLIQTPSDVTPLMWVAFLLFGVYGLALTRAWQLMAGVPAAIASRMQAVQDRQDASSAQSGARGSVHVATAASVEPADDSATL